MGNDLVVLIYNNNAHIGAMAVGDYDHHEKRASTSVITRLGHKDDAIAQKAAYSISKSTKRPVCVIAGVHLDNITGEEVDKLLENASLMVEEFIKSLPQKPADSWGQP
jgi:FixJ family two-component response regulator